MPNRTDINIFEAERIMPTEPQLRSLRLLVKDFLKKIKLIPPISEIKLSELTISFITKYPDQSTFVKLIAILINNYFWQDVVASIPYSRRVLLLPKCMQDSKGCNAKTDELGLLCELCGSCKISDYTTEAEKLGYNVIVSEGSGAVSVLLNSGQVECVIGVACLESFERTFPISLKQAIPSIAIPLFSADCKDSKTDESWLNQTIQLNGIDPFLNKVNLNELKKTIDSWFSSEFLSSLFSEQDKSTSIAIEWLQAGGKRWRPLIMLALYKVIEKSDLDINKTIAKLAIAIECFHKASLAHDDIVDNDFERYGEESLLKKHSLAITLNTGDLLLSYGYQLIAESGLDTKQIQLLINAAAVAHRELCLGQGEELLWQQQLDIPPLDKVIEIFANKTAPAFEVSLNFAAITANANKQFKETLKQYSRNIGIAYQIKDDIDDFNTQQISNDIAHLRPSLILAILAKKNKNKLSGFINNNIATEEIYNWAKNSGAIDEAKEMLENYKNKAFTSLDNLEDASVKILLYQLQSKIIG